MRPSCVLTRMQQAPKRLLGAGRSGPGRVAGMLAASMDARSPTASVGAGKRTIPALLTQLRKDDLAGCTQDRIPYARMFEPGAAPPGPQQPDCKRIALLPDFANSP